MSMPSSNLLEVARNRQTRPPPKSLSSIFVDEWNNTDDCVAIADQLCVSLNLPDLTNRSGLKRIHADLDNVLFCLDEAFRYAERIKSAMILNGVVSVYTKMCLVDALLQDKIVSRGWYKRLVSLTASPDTRHVALRAINAIAYVSGKRMCYEFVRQTPALIKVLQENLDDPIVISLVPAIFAHAECSMPEERLKEIDVRPLTVAVLEALRSPSATTWMLDHALSCLSAQYISTNKDCNEMPSYNTVRAACFRSQELRRRLQMMSSFLQSHDVHKSAPGRDWHFCSSQLGHLLDTRSLPSKLKDILNKYGQEKSQLYSSRHSNNLHIALFAEHEAEPNLLKLGRSIASQLLSHEYAVPDQLCACCGEQRHCNGCKPKWRWLELIGPCIEALRSQDGPHDQLFADVLELKQLSRTTRWGDCLDLAKKMLERHPSYSLFYLVLASVYHDKSDEKEALRISKKGLKCPDSSLWIRQELLRIAVMTAFWTALERGDIQERAALILSAYEDSKVLVDEGQPDGLKRQHDLYTFILISFIVEGDRCNPLTPGIESALEKVKINEEFIKFMDDPITNQSQNNLTARKIASVMKDAVEEWEDLLKRTDNDFLSRCEDSALLCKDSSDESMDALSAWLNRFEGETPESASPEDEIDERHRVPIAMDFQHFDRRLMQCSWCRRPSAVLKKCKRCGIAKYCDVQCQRAHWKMHKLQCVVGTTK